MCKKKLEQCENLQSLAHLLFGKRLILEEEVTTMVDFLDNDDDVDRGW